MKITGVFVVLSLAICCFSGVYSDSGTKVNCDAYLKIYRGSKTVYACPSIYRLICGTDGKVYTNQCMICQHNLDNNDNVGKKNYGLCKKE